MTSIVRDRRPGAKRAVLLLGMLLTTLGSVARAEESGETPEQRIVVSIERIWDRPAHSAFTDLIRFGDHLYCTFREGSGHIPGLNGVIRVLRSADGARWNSVALIDEPHIDLRDPKLSVTPDGRLMINCGASTYHGSKRLGIASRVIFSDHDGDVFSAPRKVEFPEQIVSGSDWLWRVTWHDGVAWGCLSQGYDKQRALRLVRSDDGVRYQPVAKLEVDGANETTLRFLDNGDMLAMIRSEGKPPWGRIGTAAPPYREWRVVESNKRLGGPNVIRLPGGAWLAGSRDYDPRATMQLWWLDVESGQYRDLLELPSGGDTSYPGMLVDAEHNRVLVSYYSSHEGKAAIYLATLRLDALEAAAKTR